MTSILFFGFYSPESPRTWTLKREYEKQGYKIVECRTSKDGFFGKFKDLIKQFKAKRKKINEVAVLFPGHHLVPLVWLMTRFPRKKLIFDVFISAYDTYVEDRKLVSKWNPRAWFYWLVDFISCHLADEVLIDTKTHREYFIKMFHLHPKRVKVIYLESRSDLFHPKKRPATSDQRPATFNIFFYGSFIPLQGIDVILKAAKILEKESRIHFTILGGGFEFKKMKGLAEELKLTNVTFIPFLPIEELPEHINKSDLCLGIFGTSQKTQRVIPHKVLDYLACGKKVLTARTPAILEKYANDDQVILCEAGNPEDLATSIKKLANAPSSARPHPQTPSPHTIPPAYQERGLKRNISYKPPSPTQ